MPITQGGAWVLVIFLVFIIFFFVHALSESVSLSPISSQFCFILELGLASLLAKPIKFQQFIWTKRLIALSLFSVPR